MPHSDVAVRFDFVDPKAVLQQGAGSAQQFLQLPESKRPHLNNMNAQQSQPYIAIQNQD